MKFLSWGKDGGPESPVDGFYIVEIKPLFSIVLLKFNVGVREAFHSHAFNAITLWWKGWVSEEIQISRSHTLQRCWLAGDIKYTSRKHMHRIEALSPAYALSFRGPWVDTWQEFKDGKYITLTHGRKVVNA